MRAAEGTTGSASAVPYAASMLQQLTTSMSFETRGRGLLDVTRPVAEWVAEAGLATGLLTVFLRRTSASPLIQENADPDVRGNLDRFRRDSCRTATRCFVIATKTSKTCRRTCAQR